MGKSVLGRLMVDFKSSGTRWSSPKWLIFHYREGRNERPLNLRNGTKGLVLGGLAKALSEKEKKRVQFPPRVTFLASKHLRIT
jgi:hypothetical protein